MAFQLEQTRQKLNSQMTRNVELDAELKSVRFCSAFQMIEMTKEVNTLFSNNETIESDLTDQPEIYQAFFEQIDKELFVRENKY